MPPATICILHCNMNVAMLTGMPALKAIRAVLVILGLMALAPAQAAGAATVAEATLKSCTSCSTVAAKDHKVALAPGATSQSGVHAGPDDGCAAGSQVFPSLAGLVAASPREAGAGEHESAASARLDRPPKVG